MAFTDVETAQVHDAVKMDPTGEDLCKLGLLYSTGQCGVIDYVEAHKWFNLASLMGSDTAKILSQRSRCRDGWRSARSGSDCSARMALHAALGLIEP